jgi:proteasome lid subunit RPN8/RPN11
MIKVNMTPSLMIKLDVLSSQYDSEIGGYLLGETKDGELVLNDLLLPDQSVTSTSVVISGKDQVNLLKRYGAEKMKKIVGHWHSHAKMGCFWSGTDRENMQNIMSYKDYFVFMVSSNKNHLCRLCIKKPITLEFENIPIELKSLTIDMLKNRVKSIFAESDNRKEYRTSENDAFYGDREENNKMMEDTIQRERNKTDIFDWANVPEDDVPISVLEKKELNDEDLSYYG